MECQNESTGTAQKMQRQNSLGVRKICGFLLFEADVNDKHILSLIGANE